MQKRILQGTLGILITGLFVAAIYYVAFYLPKKQSASIELAKLELETKLAQEKTEQLRIEKEKTDAEAEKQAELLADEKQKKESEEAQQQASAQKNTSARNTCLANVVSSYKKIFQSIEDNYDNSGSVSGLTPQAMKKAREARADSYNYSYEQANTNMDRAKNDCYHKYPLTNENF